MTTEIVSVNGHKRIRLDPESLFGSCVARETFEKLNQLGEGTYGVVYRARDIRNDKIVAVKAIRIFENERDDGMPLTALREISILRSLRHPNVVNVMEVAVGETLDGKVDIIMEYCEQVCPRLMP